MFRSDRARNIGAFRKPMLMALAGLWLAGFGLSMRYLFHYERTPGQTADAPQRWPEGVPESGRPELPTLVVALHPRCSCSEASLRELEDAARSFGRPLNTVMLIYRPEHGGEDWQSNELYRRAQGSLHALVVADADGAMAARFGAETSGEVLLYSAQVHGRRRRLLYAGGVTGARGMDGANPGADALRRAFQEQRKEPGHPVYGCGLFSRETADLAAARAVQPEMAAEAKR